MAKLDIRLGADSDDIIIEGGDIALISGRDVTAQSVRFALSTFLGEWFLDTRAGVDYFGRIFGRSNPTIRAAEIRRVMKTVPGFDEIESYRETESAGRTLNVSLKFKATADSDEGEIDAGIRFERGEGKLIEPPTDGVWNDGKNTGIAVGVYKNNIRQTHQFQDVLRELKAEHNPQHFASWAFNGSFEEDADQFPIVHQSPRLSWESVGNRQGLRCAMLNAEYGLQFGNTTDFAWMHNQRQFTVGIWCNAKTQPTDIYLMGTNIASGSSTRGFGIFKVQSSRSVYFDLFGNVSFRTNYRTGISGFPEFIVCRNFPAPSLSFTGFSAGQPISQQQPSAAGNFGDSVRPMTFMRGMPGQEPPILFNAFITNHILTDVEIYRLYLAGLNDIQEF